MHDSALDSMASDSYLLKAAPCPCQCRHAKARPSTSCGVVVALILLLATVLALAAMAYCQRMELIGVRVRISDMHREFHAVSDKLGRLNVIEQMKAFETGDVSSPDDLDRSDYLDDDDEADDEADDVVDGQDPLDPYYDADVEDTNVVEGKARDLDAGAPVARLEPASGHKQDHDAVTTTIPTTTTTSTTPGPMFMDHRRRRRQAQQGGRPQPQLKLYHMLQTPGLSAAAPPHEPWSQYGARAQGRPQAMYAEHAPMAYVTPPQRYASTTVAPVASRRSRVMAAAGTPSGQHRRRHQQHLQQHQGGVQLQHLQDVTQEVPQGGPARGVEVGRWQQQQWRGTQPTWPSPTPRPSSWSPPERAGRRRDPWQDRVRATRVTDTLQR